jgi:hypothetical protein
MESRRTLFAIGSFVLAAILTAIGTFKDDDYEVANWLIVLAISAVGAAIVFWVVLPRVERFGRTALILAVIGAITLVVFWTGLPSIFAGGAAALALTARERRAESGLATAALALAAVIVVVAVVFAFVG